MTTKTYTDDEVRAMPAGAELDRLVADAMGVVLRDGADGAPLRLEDDVLIAFCPSRNDRDFMDAWRWAEARFDGISVSEKDAIIFHRDGDYSDSYVQSGRLTGETHDPRPSLCRAIVLAKRAEGAAL